MHFYVIWDQTNIYMVVALSAAGGLSVAIFIKYLGMGLISLLRKAKQPSGLARLGTVAQRTDNQQSSALGWARLGYVSPGGARSGRAAHGYPNRYHA